MNCKVFRNMYTKLHKNRENGITLVALVITIIVLIILAGVSISFLIGEDGILTKAKYAKFLSEVSAIKEQVELKQADEQRTYSGSINEFLGITSNYNEKLIMQDGELVYVASQVSSQEEKWLEELEINKSSDYFTVEFDTAGGTEVASQTIKAGRKANKPSNPQKAGSEFLGWYYLKEVETAGAGQNTDGNVTYEEAEFNFDTAITKNYSIFAKYSGEAILMKRDFNNEYGFWQADIRTKITEIEFKQGEISVPDDAKDAWDVKADANCADIKAYIKENGEGTYSLTVISPYKIYANQNFERYFRDFTAVKTIDFSNFDTSKVKVAYSIFLTCPSLTSLDLSNWDTSNITEMSYMFDGCKSLTSLNLSNWNVSNVGSMFDMFYDCPSLTSLDLRSFTPSKVKNMENMFMGCTNLVNIYFNNFDTSNVTTMKSMFQGCKNLSTLDLSSFKTGNVTTMEAIFYGCSALTSLDLSNLNTGSVTTMESMFRACSGLLSVNLDGLETSEVTTMTNMFYACKSLTSLDLSDFDTKKVTTMPSMFWGCTGLTSLDLSSFDTSNVTNMGSMISMGEANGIYSNLRTIDISSFDTSNVTNMYCLFYNCQKLETIYGPEKFVTDKVTSSDYMFSGDSKLVGGAGTKQTSSHHNKDYAHIDGGETNPGYFTKKDV